jgi:hypothetical protein
MIYNQNNATDLLDYIFSKQSLEELKETKNQLECHIINKKNEKYNK